MVQDKRWMKIKINNLRNFYASVDYEGHNMGGGFPVHSEEEIKERIGYIKSCHSEEYYFEVIDERKPKDKQTTLFGDEK